MIPVTVNYTSTDNCSVGCVLTVASNEPINGLGDGDSAPDWQVIDAHHLLLRSERSGKGSGRTYTITVTCADPAGHTVVRTTTVVVPKSQARASTSVTVPSPPAVTRSTTTTSNVVAAPTNAASGNRGAVIYLPLSNGVGSSSAAQNKASKHATRKKKRVRTVSTRN
jgi:hypothetical protein